jgi:3-oxoacyl-[acyl-carrier protein] reductase
MENTGFHSKVAYVSGASRGIGKGIAEKLAEDGYNLSLTCEKNKTALEGLASELRDRYHVEVLTSVGDVGQYDFMKKVGYDTLNIFGHIDAVINNAGIAQIGLLTDMSPEEWDRMMHVNLYSAFYSAKVFAPAMIRQKSGSIINISSMWGRVGASCEVAYSATKGGINSFTMALAKELAPSHISVNTLALGVMDTDMNSMLTAEDKKELSNDIPAGRFGLPEEVGVAVRSLLNMPDYLTGQVIGMDGGYI